MHFFNLLLPALAALHPHSPEAPKVPGGAIYDACGHDPYFRGKRGFMDVAHAKNHAYKEFKTEARHGRIVTSQGEYFCYIYTLAAEPGKPAVFFHSAWRPAQYQKTENGSERYLVQSPYAETEVVSIYTLCHSHPTGYRTGAGPSREDVATASNYRNPDGTYRYLYLINNRGHLVQFKARRKIDPKNKAALLSMPVEPRATMDWMD